MINVIKRDGEIAEFHLGKITSAITKAFKATETDYNNEILELLALRVTADFQGKMEDGSISVEQIQDSVEHVLEQTGYTEVAKAYILYRKQRERIRNMHTTILDYRDVVNRYVLSGQRREDDPPVYSVGGLILSNSGAVTEQYWLSEIYDSEIADAHRGGEIHIQDLSMLTGCSCSWSLQKLLEEGLCGVEGMVACAPAKHLAALCNQMVNFLGIMQNEWAGAQSFSSFDTYLAPFVKADQMSDHDVKSCIESFIYGINIPSRWGTQAPCVHIGLDGVVPKELQGVAAVVGGTEQDFCYGDCQPELERIGQAVREVLEAGDAAGMPFPYPVLERNTVPENTGSIGTVCIPLGKELLSGVQKVVSGNRKLQSGSQEKQSGSQEKQSGSQEKQSGSQEKQSGDQEQLCRAQAQLQEELGRRLELAGRSLQVKRRVLEAFLKGGLYPYTWRYLGTLENHRSGICLSGCGGLEQLQKDALCDWAGEYLGQKLPEETVYLNIWTMD